MPNVFRWDIARREQLGRLVTGEPVEGLRSILEEEGPDAAWPIVLALVERADDDAMAPLGAGPLETLLRRHGPEMIGRVEARASVDRRFRFCLSHVWKGEMPDAVWTRVVGARTDEPQRG